MCASFCSQFTTISRNCILLTRSLCSLCAYVLEQLPSEQQRLSLLKHMTACVHVQDADTVLPIVGMVCCSAFIVALTGCTLSLSVGLCLTVGCLLDLAERTAGSTPRALEVLVASASQAAFTRMASTAYVSPFVFCQLCLTCVT